MSIAFQIVKWAGYVGFYKHYCIYEDTKWEYFLEFFRHPHYPTWETNWRGRLAAPPPRNGRVSTQPCEATSFPVRESSPFQKEVQSVLWMSFNSQIVIPLILWIPMTLEYFWISKSPSTIALCHYSMSSEITFPLQR